MPRPRRTIRVKLHKPVEDCKKEVQICIQRVYVDAAREYIQRLEFDDSKKNCLTNAIFQVILKKDTTITTKKE